MTTATPINPVTLPLKQVNLIQASAGTGKTYTIGSLYLRLLLQVGEDNFPRPLNVEEILVVTFTEMATEELKQKIRERITDAIQKFSAYQTENDESVFKNDEFLTALCQRIDDLSLAIQRLKLAEQNMDLASIFTIHGFCRRMLMQYAFHSGVHFNLELISDQSDLLKQFANEFWRENFYPQPFEVANFIAQSFKSPDDVLEILKHDIGKDFDAELEDKSLLTLPLEALFKKLSEQQALIEQIKQTWRENEIDIKAFIAEELNKKRLNGNKYKSNNLPGYYKRVNDWVKSVTDIKLNEDITKYFTQSVVNENAAKEKQPNHSPILEKLDELVEEYQRIIPRDLLRKLILQHYRQGIQQKLLEYKRNHQEKSFDDLLRLLSDALQSEQGNELAQMIRFQYPFAMIDEFQDTDGLQDHIFSKIYRENPAKDTGFIMIGDPKQAIYRFRGADIFTYLKAAKEADKSFYLTKNYRSEKNVVEGVNALFHFENSPFIYDNIEFSKVGAREDHRQFYLNDKREPAYRFYLTEDKLDKATLARTCAISIQHWLKSAGENKAVFRNDENEATLQAADIAVLVRDKNEAALVKNELQQLGIASVYLSDQSSVFDSRMAKDLVQVLKACLNVAERPILNAIATALFGLNTAEIHQIHHDEQNWQRWAESFARYQQTWQRQGVLPMLHQLLLEQNIAERLLSQATGERDLTDFLHLAEILQQATSLNESEAALLSWFEKQIQGEGRQEAQIRLESERQLVKIVTIHKSKGLEYGLVWLPFLAVPSRDPSKSNKQLKDVNLYYDKDKDRIFWDMQNRHLAALYQEAFAEELRLLYVALTRAKYQMAFALPTQFDKKWNPLLYVLTQGAIGETADLSQTYATESLLNEFKARMQDVEIDPAEKLEKLPPLSLSYQETDLAVAKFDGKIEQDWRVTSFTGIEQAHTRRNYLNESAVKQSVIFDESKDYDSQTEVEKTQQDLTALSDEDEQIMLELPRGKQVGTLLHRYLEKNNFDALTAELSMSKLCQDLQLDETFVEPLQSWFSRIVQTPLQKDSALTLATLPSEDCIKEMPFYLAIQDHFNVSGFNQALSAYHHLPSESLQFEDIQGMLRGTIDLVFRHNGQYYLLDYKSNFLGEHLVDYAPKALQKAMLHHHYDWQYLLYTLALHRYLKSVDKGYDYERDFGGVFYLFLRGMNGEAQSGVFFDRPDIQLIRALEEAF